MLLIQIKLNFDLIIFMYKVSKGITPNLICEIFQRASGTQCCEARYTVAFKKEIKAVTSCSTHKIDQQETDG